MKNKKLNIKNLLLTASITLALTSWGSAQTYKQKAAMLERESNSLMLDVMVLEQKVELIKKELRAAPNDVIKPLPVVTQESRIDELQTPLESILAMDIPKLTNYIELDVFIRMAIEYNIDPGFAIATWALETGWGKSDAWLKRNNPAGLTCNGSYCAYKSKQNGIEDMFVLFRAYADGSIPWVGTRRTVDAVRKKWSATEDTATIIEIWNNIIQKGGR